MASRPAWTRTVSMIEVTPPRAPSTPGIRPSWSRCSEPRTAPGRAEVFARHRGGHVRARPVHAAAGRRPRSGAAGAGSLGAAGGPRRATPTRPRRQGGGGLERLADPLPGAGGRGVRPTRLAGGGAAGCRADLAAALGRRPAAADLPGRGGRGRARGAGGLRGDDHGLGRAGGRRGGRGLVGAGRAARPGDHHRVRRRRRLLRHGRGRREPVPATAGSRPTTRPRRA